MGKKLSRDEKIESIGALQRYYFKRGKSNGPYVAEIVVIDEDTDEVEKLKTIITVAFESMTQRINIMWEDAGYSVDEYRNKGLFGYYDCAWVPMRFRNDALEIRSLDSNKKIYVY